MKRIAIVPAYNEQGAIGRVVDELRAADESYVVLVIDDASHHYELSRKSFEIASPRSILS